MFASKLSWPGSCGFLGIEGCDFDCHLSEKAKSYMVDCENDGPFLESHWQKHRAAERDREQRVTPKILHARV